jgi:hypothetical protein
MSKKKSRTTKQLFIDSKDPTAFTCAYQQLDAIIAMLGHVDANGKLHSKIHFPTSDKEVLESVERVIRQVMTLAINQHDVAQFRKAYVALERILGIDMENYEGLEVHCPAEGITINTSPAEACLAYKAWPVVAEVFKLSLAHPGLAFRQGIDTPTQLIHCFGRWLIAPEFQSEVAGITQVANEAVFLFLSEVKPIAQAQGVDLKLYIQGLVFLKRFPILEQIFWTQHAALSV